MDPMFNAGFDFVSIIPLLMAAFFFSLAAYFVIGRKVDPKLDANLKQLDATVHNVISKAGSKLDRLTENLIDQTAPKDDSLAKAAKQLGMPVETLKKMIDDGTLTIQAKVDN